MNRKLGQTLVILSALAALGGCSVLDVDTRKTVVADDEPSKARVARLEARLDRLEAKLDALIANES